MDKVKDLSIYEKKFSEDPSLFNDFQAMDFVKELKNQNRLDEAIEAGKTFLQYDALTSFKNQYAYALYNKYINISDEEIENKPTLFESIANEIISLTVQEKYSPLEVTVNKMIKRVLKNKPVDYKQLNQLLSHLDPELCDGRPMNVQGHEAESRKERYYRLKVRALYELGDYKECIEVANKAVDEDLKWHNHALNWVQFYKAESLFKLGNYDEAEVAYISLGKGIPQGNLDDILVNLYKVTGNTNASNTNLIYKFFLAGYSFKQLKLYQAIDEMIKADASQTDLIALSSSYLYKLLEENNKPVDAYVLADQYKEKTSSELYDRLYNILMKNLSSYIKRQSGKVTRYFEDHEYGNIISKGNQVFFRQADFIYDVDVERGDKVEFSVVKNYDVKRKTITTKAVLIKSEY